MTTLQMFIMLSTNMREAVLVCTGALFINHSVVFSLVYIEGFTLSEFTAGVTNSFFCFVYASIYAMVVTYIA